MDIFAKLGATLSEAGKDVSQKSRELTGIARLSIDIRAKENYIQLLYAQIGMKYYELHKEDVEPLMEEMTLIREAEEQISIMAKEIAELKGQKQCPACGEALSDKAHYCQRCGLKYESVYEEEV